MKRAFVTLVLLGCGNSAPATSTPTSAPSAAEQKKVEAAPSASVVASSASATAAAAAPAPEDPNEGEPLGSPVSNAATTSSGAVADANDVIIAMRPRFKACYQSVKVKGDPPIVGMVSVGMRITKEGKVASQSLTRRDRLPMPLVNCLMNTLKTAAFKPLPEEVVIQVPVRFAGRDED